MLAILSFMPALASGQTQGFAVERFYPSAPGSGWFVMDDLNMAGKLGGTIALTSGYARNPFEIGVPGASGRLALVSNQSFLDVGAAVTYDRYRFYFNLPMPLLVTGQSGTVGTSQVSAPNTNLGTNPDTVSDSRIGFDMRLIGKAGSGVRLGLGAQLIIPSGERIDYVTDGRYRGMFRFLAAGDKGPFSYAGHFGVHIRPTEGLVLPGSPNGNEYLFGVSAGRKISDSKNWTVIAGPEFFGESAVHSSSSDQSGMEGLLTGRFEKKGDGAHLRVRLSIGHGLVHHFGTPEWRILAGVELFGRRP